MNLNNIEFDIYMYSLKYIIFKCHFLNVTLYRADNSVEQIPAEKVSVYDDIARFKL